MQDIQIKWGLWHKKEKQLLKYSTSSNAGAQFCGETSTELDLFGNKDWLVDTPVNAEYVRNYTTHWYNAGYDTPMNNFNSDELIVVKVRVETNIEDENVLIPTPKELFTEKYLKSNPDHLKRILEKMDSGGDIKYSYYDLLEHIENKIAQNKAKQKT